MRVYGFRSICMATTKVVTTREYILSNVTRTDIIHVIRSGDNCRALKYVAIPHGTLLKLSENLSVSQEQIRDLSHHKCYNINFIDGIPWIIDHEPVYVM